MGRDRCHPFSSAWESQQVSSAGESVGQVGLGSVSCSTCQLPLDLEVAGVQRRVHQFWLAWQLCVDLPAAHVSLAPGTGQKVQVAEPLAVLVPGQPEQVLVLVQMVLVVLLPGQPQQTVLVPGQVVLVVLLPGQPQQAVLVPGQVVLVVLVPVSESLPVFP